MVSLTFEFTEQRAAALRARADAEGVSVTELVAKVLMLDRGDVDYDFTAWREAEILASLEQADRGDAVSFDVAMAAVRALRR
jgi:hypothetical protein